MHQATLELLQRDLDAAGLEGRVKSELIGYVDAALLVEDEDDLDRAHAGTVGLSHRLPHLPASSRAHQTRAVAEALQAALVETERVQWPVCVEHSGNLLTPQTADADDVIWVCASADPRSQAHLVGGLGHLSEVSARIGIRGRLPRRRSR